MTGMALRTWGWALATEEPGERGTPVPTTVVGATD